jgi:AcrR family transcriptional regulator
MIAEETVLGVKRTVESESPRRSVGSSSKSSPRVRVNVQRIVDTAMVILDEGGIESLTTRELSSRLHVSQPTIYSHVRSLAEVRSLVAVQGIAELGERLRTAVLGRSGDDALHELALEYRSYVKQHPDRYLLQLVNPGTDLYTEAAAGAATAVRAVLRSYGVPEEEIPSLHHMFRAAVHGFVHLEANNAISADVDPDDAYEVFVRFLARGLKNRGPGEGA